MNDENFKEILENEEDNIAGGKQKISENNRPVNHINPAEIRVPEYGCVTPKPYLHISPKYGITNPRPPKTPPMLKYGGPGFSSENPDSPEKNAEE